MAIALAWAVDVPTAVSLGDCGTALDLLDPDDPRDAAQLARGWCLAREGAPFAALDALPQEGALGGYGRLVAAQRWVALGQEAEALAALEGAAPPGRAGRAAQLLRGRLLAPYGDDVGLRALRDLLDSDVGDEARFWLAEALGVQGDVAGAIEHFHQVWTDARPGGWDGRAATRLQELGVSLDDTGSTAGRAKLEARLAGLQRHRRAEEARALAEVLYAHEAPADREGQLFLGRVFYDARAYERALGVWRQALGVPGEATGTPDEMFDYALCHARTDDYDTAAIVYERLFQAHPTHEKADFASFKLGYMKYDRNECDAALAAFDAHRQRYPDSEHLDEALWFSSRCLWRARRYDDATHMLSTLEERRPKSSLMPGAYYWRARAAGLKGDAASEHRRLQHVVTRWPTSGYAWFAATRLDLRFPPPPPVAPPAFPPDWARKGRRAAGAGTARRGASELRARRARHPPRALGRGGHGGAGVGAVGGGRLSHRASPRPEVPARRGSLGGPAPAGACRSGARGTRVRAGIRPSRTG